MNWFDQSRLKNMLIILLLLMNIISLSIIWLQMAGANADPRLPKQAASSESVEAMREVVGFSAEQSERFAVLLQEYREQTRPLNERMGEIKRRMAESVFHSDVSADSIRQMSAEIGMLQQTLEELRFHHFRTVTEICDSAQRERLRPVLAHLFGRKPLKEGEEMKKKVPGAQESKRPNRKAKQEREKPSKDRPVPPSVEEKVQKYSERLSLSKDQERRLTELLSSMRREDRGKGKGGQSSKDKEQVRKMEDEKVMEILTPQQREEFRRMQERRRN